METINFNQSGDFTYTVGANQQALLLVQPPLSKPLNLTVELKGPGAEASVVGLFDQRREETSDFNLLIHHQTPHTKAKVLVKGILNDQAKANFSGLIKIDPNSQQTESFLEHRTLLLSDQAEVKPVPSLEIAADDVKASHAAAISSLSDEDRFYLQSRGLNQKQADKLLIDSFLAPVKEYFHAK